MELVLSLFRQFRVPLLNSIDSSLDVIAERPMGGTRKAYHFYMICQAMFLDPIISLIYDRHIPLVGKTGPWQSGLMRRTYNPVKRVRARSEGPNPSGPAIYGTIGT